MEKQRWEESEKRREEKKREEKRRRKNIKKEKVSEKEDPGALKGRKVAKNCVFSNDLWLRSCCVKHISKSKCAEHTGFGALLEVEMLKKCTPLWREASCQVKMFKIPTCSDHFWTLRCHFAWQAQGIVHLVKSEQNVRVL